MTLDTLKELIGRRFADPEERQNLAPTLDEFVYFAERLPKNVSITFDGYVVSILRDDYRVSIDAITVRADDDVHITQDSFYAWWD